MFPAVGWRSSCFLTESNQFFSTWWIGQRYRIFHILITRLFWTRCQCPLIWVYVLRCGVMGNVSGGMWWGGGGQGFRMFYGILRRRFRRRIFTVGRRPLIVTDAHRRPWLLLASFLLLAFSSGELLTWPTFFSEPKKIRSIRLKASIDARHSRREPRLTL